MGKSDAKYTESMSVGVQPGQAEMRGAFAARHAGRDRQETKIAALFGVLCIK
jgi:hypothetical protein